VTAAQNERTGLGVTAVSCVHSHDGDRTAFSHREFRDRDACSAFGVG
jgi:hypothetical protein